MAYVFFASYARADKDAQSRVLEKFIKNLREDVASETGEPQDQVCFFDLGTIPIGAEWKRRL